MSWLNKITARLTAGLESATEEMLVRRVIEQEVPRHVRAGDWDAARLALRKLAYTSKRLPEALQARIADANQSFAATDPLYGQWLGVVRTVVREEPGIAQTELKREFLSELPREDADYVLYFAERLGEIRRERRGSTFRLFLADDGRGDQAP